MEQDLRQKAINLYLKGGTPKSIYLELNRSKNWFFKWLKRYQTGDPDWYKDKSPEYPKRNPQRSARLTDSELYLFELALIYRNLLRSVLLRSSGNFRSQALDFHPTERLIES